MESSTIAQYRSVRIEQTEEDPHGQGYLALWLTQPDGQWALAVDGSYGSVEERVSVHAQLFDLVARYFRVEELTSPF